jgi:lysyl-tRNA synthetase class 1
MYWADKLVQTISNKNSQHRVDDMKTVSGMPHVGSLRSILTHDIVYKAMLDAGYRVDFTYVFNDMDPMDGLPVYLDQQKYLPYMGKPLYQIPSPVAGYDSFGHYYAAQYQMAFNKVGCQPNIIWSHELYAAGQMNDTIRQVLDQAEQIRQIYLQVSEQQKPANWHPYQVICPQCGKVGSTIVTAWDSAYVTYECRPDLVKWAVGCGHSGKIKPINENGKLMWKVDWPAHWKVMNITVEGAGKDHFTEGGSRDIGVEICKQVFQTDPPFGFLHEFFLVGGKKMSSSKGTGISADQITQIISPELVRFLIARTPLRRQVSFDPYGMDIPDLFDEYDRCAQVWWQQGGQDDFGRIYQLSQVKDIVPDAHFIPRFREVANVLQQPSQDVRDYFQQQKGTALTKQEQQVLDERITYAKIWLEKYAPEELRLSITDKVPGTVYNYTPEQFQYVNSSLATISDAIEFQNRGGVPNPDEIQQALYQHSKDQNMRAKDAFGTIYTSLINKPYGPKAGPFLIAQGLDKVKQRFEQVVKIGEEKSAPNKSN